MTIYFKKQNVNIVTMPKRPHQPRRTAENNILHCFTLGVATRIG